MQFIKSHAKLLIVISVIFIFGVILIFLLPRNHLLTHDELNMLIAEMEINPISINDIGDSYTDIVYTELKGYERLELIAYKDRWGKIHTEQYAFYKSRRIDKVDVEYWGSKFSYDFDGYVGIDILNKEILTKAYSAEVTFENGFVSRAYFHNSSILLLQAKSKYFWESPRFTKIEIYNDKGEVIHGMYF